MESSNLWDFVSQYFPLILGIFGLAIALVNVRAFRKADSTPEACLSKQEIAQAEVAGERARDDVRKRYGKYFGRGKP